MENSKSHYLVWFNLSLAIFIILWGAWVRLSGSGAGCGEHWPLCNGSVIPLDPSSKTLTEFFHRLTSGIFGITVVAQWLWGRKLEGKDHPFTKSSLALCILTLIEALIGAVLVKKGLVDRNASSLRALVIALHLANTLLLLSSLIASLYFKKFQRTHKFRGINSLSPWAKGALILFPLVACSGAVVALGNTLFPETSLIDGVLKDFQSSSHFLIRLRILHPIMALGLVLMLVKFGHEQKDRLGFFIELGALIALGFGIINWLLLAPAWGALTHLFIADLLWYLLCYKIFSIFFPAKS